MNYWLVTNTDSQCRRIAEALGDEESPIVPAVCRTRCETIVGVVFMTGAVFMRRWDYFPGCRASDHKLAEAMRVGL